MKKKLAAIAALIFSVVTVILVAYFFWASNRMWLVVPASTLYVPVWYFLTRKKYKKDFLRDIAYYAFLVWIALALSIVSTLVQHWVGITALLWEALISAETWMVIGGLALILAIAVTYKWTVSKLAEKKQKREAAVRKAEEEKQLQIAKRQEQERIERLLQQEEVSFKDLIGINNVPQELVLKVNFLNLIEVSHVRRKINFSPCQVGNAIHFLENFFRDCYDDKVLQEFQKKFDFQRIQNYTGFEALKEKIEAYSDKDFQKFIGL